MRALLKPPAEPDTWDGYEGCPRQPLNGERRDRYLTELLKKHLGAPPPYTR